MRRREGQRGLQVAPGFLQRLLGQRIHQVEVEIIEMLLRNPDRAPRLVAVVDAAQRLAGGAG